MSKYKIDFQKDQIALLALIKEIVSLDSPSEEDLHKLLRKYPRSGGLIFSKSELIAAYEVFKASGKLQLSKRKENVFFDTVRMKKVRTLSGVTTVAVLTKPFYCPGKCIYCPLEEGMPKSYLSNEPGAQRAVANNFDPYLQVFNRLVALRSIGHATDKVELIVLGGSWSVYPEEYQIWFIKRCFEALNDFGPHSKPLNPENFVYREGETSWEDLFKVHGINETAKSRCVGLSLETRPDLITKKEVLGLRKLGATKIQIGIQSLSDSILKKNVRGHTLKSTTRAFALLRLAGFKIHAHWMPNLYGSDVSRDKKGYVKLFEDPRFRPDELKIYPCSLLEGTKLMEYYQKGLWVPYSYDELVDVLEFAFENTPRYCRITRVIRDIPAESIAVGNKVTNLRQIIENNLLEQGKRSLNIRAREIRNRELSFEDLRLNITEYKTSVSKEFFIEYVTPADEIAGFLRLSLPWEKPYIEELAGSAMIREVHVYGESIGVGKTKKGKAQHGGLGTKLVSKALRVAKKEGFSKVAVISAVGTRGYYKKLGFKNGVLYQFIEL